MYENTPPFCKNILLPNQEWIGFIFDSLEVKCGHCRLFTSYISNVGNLRESVNFSYDFIMELYNYLFFSSFKNQCLLKDCK
jgi:hypothetical protein